MVIHTESATTPPEALPSGQHDHTANQDETITELALFVRDNEVAIDTVRTNLAGAVKAHLVSPEVIIARATAITQEQQPRGFEKWALKRQISFFIYFFFTFEEAFKQRGDDLVELPLREIEKILRKGWGLLVPQDLKGTQRMRYVLNILEEDIPQAVRLTIIDLATQCCEQYIKRLSEPLNQAEYNQVAQVQPGKWTETQKTGWYTSKQVSIKPRVLEHVWQAFMIELGKYRTGFDQNPMELIQKLQHEIIQLDKRAETESGVNEAEKKIQEAHQLIEKVWELCGLDIQKALKTEYLFLFNEASPAERANYDLMDRRVLFAAWRSNLTRALIIKHIAPKYTQARGKDQPDFETFIMEFNEHVQSYDSYHNQREAAEARLNYVSPFHEKPIIVEEFPSLAFPFLAEYVTVDGLDQSAHQIPVIAPALMKIIMDAFSEFDKNRYYEPVEKGQPVKKEPINAAGLLKAFLEILEKRIKVDGFLSTWEKSIAAIEAFRKATSSNTPDTAS